MKNVISEQTVETKIIRVPKLHIICGNEYNRFNKNETSNVRLLYFMRNQEAAVPFFSSCEKCVDSMTAYFSIGSLEGNVANAMIQIFSEVTFIVSFYFIVSMKMKLC